MKTSMITHQLLANISITDYGFFAIYFASVTMLAACLVIAVKVKEIQRSANKNIRIIKEEEKIQTVMSDMITEKKAV